MLEVLIGDSLKAAVAREVAAALAAERPALDARINAANTRVFASPGILLPHLHLECAGGAQELAAAGVTAWTLAVYGTDAATLAGDMAGLEGSALAAGEGFRGLFVEGPYIDGGAEFDAGALEAFLDGAALPIAALVFAPERLDVEAATAILEERDILAVVGHTRADYEAAKAAFVRGATTLSLPFMSTATLHHRNPGPIGAAAEALARCEIPMGAPGFSAQMAGVLSAAFGERAEPVYHPVAHPGRAAAGAVPADFAKRAAAAMGLGAREFLVRYAEGPLARDTFVLFDEGLAVLASVAGGKAVYESREAAG